MIFSNFLVCVTGLTVEQREHVKRCVTQNGGKYDGALFQNSQVLVGNRACGQKYDAAKEWGVPVVSTEWIEDSLRHGKAADLKDKRYAVLPFTGLNVCVTGFSIKERTEIQKAVEDGGGKYSGAMNRFETTHLVAEEFKGPKCEAAVLWNREKSIDVVEGNRGTHQPTEIKIVGKAWVDACKSTKRYIPEAEHRLQYPNAEMTAISETLIEEQMSVTKSRSHHPRKQRNPKRDLTADLTATQTASRKRLAPKKSNIPGSVTDESLKKSAQQRESQIREQSELAETLRRNGEVLSILETCCVYLYGFEGSSRKIWRICLFLVQCTGATVYFEWNKNVSHIVCADESRSGDAYIALLKESSPSVTITDMGYITECLKAKKRLSEPKSGTQEASNGREADAPAAAFAKDTQKLKSSAPRLNLSEVLTTTGNENSLKNQAMQRTPKRLRPTIVEKPITKFQDAVICVSRYTNDDRSRVKEIAQLLGSRFTETLTKNLVTHLISKDGQGEKVVKAREWGIPVFNLVWLENQLRRSRNS